MILTLNSGSSSLKFALYRNPDCRLFSGILSGIATGNGKFRVKHEERSTKSPGGSPEENFEKEADLADHESAIELLLDWLRHSVSTDELDVVGHRVVHGGSLYVKPRTIDEALMKELERLKDFAPLHLPPSIDTLKAALRLFPDVPQVACFDTSFHRTIPEVARILPINRTLFDQGVEKFGFHGLSYEFVLQELKDGKCEVDDRDLWRKKLIIGHLGNGCSLAAVHQGRSIETTMAFSPASGLVMGTRCGDVDAGLISYYCGTKGHSAEEFVELVNKKSGLLGLSELSSDMQTLLQEEERNEKARQAIQIFCYHARRHIGALSAVLDGLDALVFTGGIGENAHQIRERIGSGLSHLGIEIDAQRNGNGENIISKDGARTRVLVIKTNEELMIARHARALVPAKNQN